LCTFQKYLRSPCDLPAVMTSRDWGVKAATWTYPQTLCCQIAHCHTGHHRVYTILLDSTDGSIAQSTANQNNPTARKHSEHWLIGICLQERSPRFI
jgi:hypothetical protein